ncbi:FG-GAP repeat domain-containing protein [Algoriphagus persicinus]|uniref:FG-GAP repeat domain-containing protein n=1 Tax=Algoriphagus persicinus TaxID=3108754 RepID=UPI002B3E5EAE|nr:VCBS repeat-containing protein [Algoriphagus sp. E1-3-M2]MEB2784925.1 VCBS repeat-containing protein [Algoriphagus sp. E1-3-M2]
MTNLKYALPLLISLPLFASAQETTVKFEKQVIAFESTESVGVFDVDNDGTLDLVSGSYWYRGPEFLDRFLIGQVKRYVEWHEDFSTIPMDVNEDGKMDFVTGGWFEGTLVWKENPGDGSEWPIHEIAKTGNIETARGFDIDGDGVLELVPNTPRKALAYYKKTGANQFEKFPVADLHGHGLGFGDINGDGRGDLVISDGWLEAPSDLKTEKWIHHADFELGDASIPMIVTDVNADGMADLIVGQAHGFGLFWLEQKKEGEKRNFVKHEIDPFQSQYHTMEWVDIDNDGQNELITGKRYRAHNGKDPGGKDYSGLYYFKWNGESFTKNIISYGPLGEGKGSGLYFSVIDLNEDDKLDIAVAGKDGLVVFWQK